MRNLGHHPADGVVVRTLNHLVQPLLFHRSTNRGTHPLQVNLSAARIRFFRRHFQNLDLAFGWRSASALRSTPFLREGFSPWTRLQFLRRLTAHGGYALARFQLLQGIE